MKHSTEEFELTLKAMGVEIIEIKKNQFGVYKVIGRLNKILYHWDAFGSCFLGLTRYPDLDIKFIIISSDRRTVQFGNEIHFKKPITIFTRLLTRGVICSKCSLVNECDNDLTDDTLVKLCCEGFNGYFKLIKK